MSGLYLACNIQTKGLAGKDGSVTGLPVVYQTNSQPLRIQPVNPDVSAEFNQTFTVLDCAAKQLRVVISGKATGEEGDETEQLLAAAYEAAWAWDAALDSFTGNIDLHTAEVAAFLDEASQKTALIEINLIESGRATTIFQGSITIRANIDSGGSSAPSVLSPAPASFTRAMIDGADGVSIAENVVTISGLGLGFTPSNILPFMAAPAGAGAITPDYVVGSATTDAVTFVLSAIPSSGYILTFIPVP